MIARDAREQEAYNKQRGTKETTSMESSTTEAVAISDENIYDEFIAYAIATNDVPCLEAIPDTLDNDVEDTQPATDGSDYVTSASNLVQHALDTVVSSRAGITKIRSNVNMAWVSC